MAVAGIACGATASTSGGPPCATVERSQTTSPELRALEKYVPADANAVVSLDLGVSVWSWITHGWLVPMSPSRREGLDRDLSALIEQHSGLKWREAKAAVGFLWLEDGPGDPVVRGAAIVGGVEGTLKGTRDYNGHALVTEGEVAWALHDKTLVIGSVEAVKKVLDGGEAQGAFASTPLASWYRSQCDGASLCAAASAEGMPAALRARAMGIERSVARLDRKGVKVAVEGPGAQLKMLQALIHQGLDAARHGAESKRAEAMAAADPGQAIGMILGYHLAQNVLDRAQPRLEGETLWIEVPLSLDDPMTVAPALLGVVAAVAIPSFVRYRDKALEAKATAESVD